MSTGERKPWTRDELILAINLYCKTPFGRIHVRNPEIIELARILERTPGSVSYKLANFANIDPSLERKGASHVSKLDVEVWNEFFTNWDDMVFESEKSLPRSKAMVLCFLKSNCTPKAKQGKRLLKPGLTKTFSEK